MLQRLHILGVSLPCPYLAQSHCCFGRMSSPKLQTLNPSIDAAGLVILFRCNQLETEPQPPHPPPPTRRGAPCFLFSYSWGRSLRRRYRLGTLRCSCCSKRWFSEDQQRFFCWRRPSLWIGCTSRNLGVLRNSFKFLVPIILKKQLQLHFLLGV